METTKNAPDTLFTFECNGREKHRIYRRSQSPNNASCSRCGGVMFHVLTTQRREGESQTQHEVRALTAKKELVN